MSVPRGSPGILKMLLSYENRFIYIYIYIYIHNASSIMHHASSIIDHPSCMMHHAKKERKVARLGSHGDPGDPRGSQVYVMQKIGHQCAFSWAVRRENLTKSCAQVPRRFLAYQNRKTKPPETTYERKTGQRMNVFNIFLFKDFLGGFSWGPQGSPGTRGGMSCSKSGMNVHLVKPLDLKT